MTRTPGAEMTEPEARAKAAPDFAALGRAFALPGDFRGAVPHGNGHINDTWAATVEQAGTSERFLLQRVNDRVFRRVAELMENVQRVTAHASAKAAADGRPDAARRALTLVPAGDGRPYHRDAAGGWWRCYRMVENARSFDAVETPRQAYAAAKAFGEFQRLLVDLPGGRLHETIPDFHHTRKRLAALQRAVAEDPCNRAQGAKEAIAFALAREPLAGVLLDLQARGEVPERVTHNDAKLDNVLLDAATAEGLCVVDLDTTMPGLALYDFGDLVRSATSAAGEEERDLARVNARLPIFEALAEGFLAATGDFLTEAEVAHLAVAGQLMTYENGMRFLTDYLTGDTYYKTQRPGQNLDRAANQFALVRSLEAQRGAMEAVVRKIRRGARREA